MLFNVVTYISEHYLTLINAALFYYNHHPPSNQPKNQSFRLNHGRTLKYRQLFDSRKKIGSIAPKLGPYHGIKISAKIENRDFEKFANFDLVYLKQFKNT